MPLYDLYYKLFEQGQTPVYTGISVVTTIAVESLIFIAAAEIHQASFGALGAALIGGLFVILGILINTGAGFVAHQRRECWGGRIATAGIVIWTATLAFLRP